MTGPNLDSESNRSLLASAGRILAVAVVAGSFAIWIYAYSGAAAGDRQYIDQLDNPEFSQSAEGICSAAMAELASLPNAKDAASAVDRADDLDVTNVLLNSMIDDLERIDLSTASDRDQGVLSKWISEYRILVQDRQAWADELRVDPTARLTYTNLGTGRIETRLTQFSEANYMASCSSPQDIG